MPDLRRITTGTEFVCWIYLVSRVPMYHMVRLRPLFTTDSISFQFWVTLLVSYGVLRVLAFT